MTEVGELFNISPFNRAPFNRSATLETYFGVTIDSSSEFIAQLNGVFPVSIIFDTTTELIAPMTREMPIVMDVIDTATEMLSNLLRQRILDTIIDTSTEFSVKVQHLHVDEIVINGDIAAGDRLVIDTRNLTVTLNGENALHLLNGDFFDLVLGNNKITYTDASSSRNVLMRVTHRDKFV